MKMLLILAKALEKQKFNFNRSVLFHMKTRADLKYFVNDCSSNSGKLNLNLNYNH